MAYIHELAHWPYFTWSSSNLVGQLSNLRFQQGQLLGKMKSLGLYDQSKAHLESLSLEIVRSSEIEGAILPLEQVRSSLARRLGLEIESTVKSPRFIDGYVEVMLDACQNFEQPMNSDRLFNWHGSLFPTGRSGLQKIAVGQWRGDEYGPMQVVSGPLGRERVHFEAPPAQRIDKEMEAYWKWFNSSHGEDSILAAGIGHLWFVTIHPFEDGNGRLARALTEILLCRSDSSPLRFYSMSNQIETHRKNYYLKLETAQKGELDITEWLLWFMQELHGALKFSDNILENVVQKTHFWELLRERRVILNSRQTKMIQALLEGFKGKLSSSKYAKFCNCSQDTALRDLQDLMIKGVVVQSEQGGRSTSYEFNLKK